MLYVIAGPTAVGKTAVAIELARQVGGEIINADSMQVYRGMDIGTAKPTREEQGGIPHHLLDVAAPDEAFSAARFQALAREAMADIVQRGSVPILVGGTGFYINAVVYGTEFSHQSEAATQAENARRTYWMDLAAKEGAPVLHTRLARLDPAAAAKIHPNNSKRVARALAFCESTNTLFSTYNAAQREKKHKGLSLDTEFIVLTMPRPLLYERINARTDAMLKAGLAAEVAGLLAGGYAPHLPAMQAIGYKEVIANAVPLAQTIAQHTRNYAKRQITWFTHNAPHGRIIDASHGDTQAIVRNILM